MGEEAIMLFICEVNGIGRQTKKGRREGETPTTPYLSYMNVRLAETSTNINENALGAKVTMLYHQINHLMYNTKRKRGGFYSRA